MSLGALGEDALIARLLRGLPKVTAGAGIVAGAGDDCAIIGRPRDRRWTLLKADALVENVHFLRETEPRRVGWKALCRAISDIAAMGGEPRHALITIAVPRTLPVEWLDGLYAGLKRAAKKFGVAIVGGETVRSPGPIFINVSLTGEVERTECVRRSGGKPGDRLYVTGRLGGSIAGKHLDFTPRLAEARWLVSHWNLQAMMDLSDGLGADLPRLAAASGCSFRLEMEALPCTAQCSPKQALTDGEDYELLFALPRKYAAGLELAWQTAFPKLPLTCIGTLEARSKLRQPSIPRGFDHFQ